MSSSTPNPGRSLGYSLPFLKSRHTGKCGSVRHLDHAPQDRQVLSKRFLANRVFHEVRRKRLDQVAAAYGVRKVKPLVKIDHPFAVLPDALARLHAILINLMEPLP